jgi:acetylcholinesterase
MDSAPQILWCFYTPLQLDTMKQTLFRVVSLAAAFASSLAAPSVTVKNGTYTGVSVASFKQELFLGMPFAQPPIPRLYAPKSLNSSWTGERKAEKYSPICIGYGYDDFGYETSEDCLTLNVVRPEGIKKGSNVPVMVWI